MARSGGDPDNKKIREKTLTNKKGVRVIDEHTDAKHQTNNESLALFHYIRAYNKIQAGRKGKQNEKRT